jgi:hypothetical protein
MADKFSELDSEGVYVGMSLEDFGVRVSHSGVKTMPRDSLRKAIEHLRGELASGQPLSSEERSHLDRVLSEVAGILEPESDDSGPGEDFVDELRDFTERFEKSHPEVALILGRIMDSLSQLGI